MRLISYFARDASKRMLLMIDLNFKKKKRTKIKKKTSGQTVLSTKIKILDCSPDPPAPGSVIGVGLQFNSHSNSGQQSNARPLFLVFLYLTDVQTHPRIPWDPTYISNFKCTMQSLRAHSILGLDNGFSCQFGNHIRRNNNGICTILENQEIARIWKV